MSCDLFLHTVCDIILANGCDTIDSQSIRSVNQHDVNQQGVGPTVACYSQHGSNNIGVFYSCNYTVIDFRRAKCLCRLPSQSVEMVN